MLNWIERKRIREQMKLLYQNQSAAIMLAAYTSEHDPENLHPWLVEVQQKVGAIGRTTENGTQLADADDIAWLLATNRALRRIYDRTTMSYRARFDEEFVPLGGWKYYYNRFD